MAGVTLTVALDDAEIRTVLDRLLAATTDLSPLMRDIGEHLLATTRERFDAQESPAGTPWAPLTIASLEKKARETGKILTERGFLRGTLAYRAGPTSVEVGSPLIYAGTHQFGAKKGSFRDGPPYGPIPWGDIPARRFLGVSDDDAAEILVLGNDFLAEFL